MLPSTAPPPNGGRKTRLVEPHRSGILIPPWWRKRRAVAVFALSVASVVAALLVIGAASERIQVAESPPIAQQTPAQTAAADEPAGDPAFEEEPLPADIYENAPVILPPNPADGVLHAIEDPGSVYEAARLGPTIDELVERTSGLPSSVNTAEDEARETPKLTAGRPKLDSLETASLPTADSETPPSGENAKRNTHRDAPAWVRNALPFDAAPDEPLVAIVIDDMGVSRRYSDDAVKLPGPLTMSFLSYAHDLNLQAEGARRAGHEIMLHVPMEPGSTTIDPGPNVLLAGTPATEIRANLDWAMAQLDGFVGVNNHMGSRFTGDPDGMRVVLATLARSGHLFLDSRTSGASVAAEVARKIGLPFATRNVFIDHDDDAAVIREQLRQTERLAHKNGAVIAIGHPRPRTIEALEEWLPKLARKGLRLAPVSAVVRRTWLATQTVSSR